MQKAITELTAWYAASLQTGGYPLIILLMAIESSFIPVPSELVIPPAAYLAHSQGHMSLQGVVLAGAFGSWVGATIMYWASRLAGRPLVLSWGRYFAGWFGRIMKLEAGFSKFGPVGRFIFRFFVRFPASLLLITDEKIEHAELWSARYGNFGVFFSRLLPVVRHLIGIPFGIVRLNYAKYSLCTLLGSLTWCAVLSWVGILAGNNKALMAGDLKTVTIWIAVAFAVLSGLYYFFVHRQMRRAA